MPFVRFCIPRLQCSTAVLIVKKAEVLASTLGPQAPSPKCSDSNVVCLFRQPHSSYPRGHGDQDRHVPGTPGSVNVHMHT